MIDDIKDNEWYTMREASEILGKNPRYFITLKQREPEYFEEVTFRPVGTALVLTGKDIKKVISKVKKEGDPLRTVILKVVYKAKKQGFCFYPQAIIIP